jgi:hypothetical protein
VPIGFGDGKQFGEVCNPAPGANVGCIDPNPHAMFFHRYSLT